MHARSAIWDQDIGRLQERSDTALALDLMHARSAIWDQDIGRLQERSGTALALLDEMRADASSVEHPYLTVVREAVLVGPSKAAAR